MRLAPLSSFFTDLSKVDIFCFYVSNLSMLISCWEKADLLALLCVMFSCVFVTFPISVPGHIFDCIDSWPLFMLNSSEQEISTAHKN